MKKTSQDDIRRLRDDASAKLAAGKKKEAVALFEQLTLLEPTSGDWPRRAAECHAELGRPKEQRKYLLVALQAYSRGGQVLKAIAMGKLAQKNFPGDADVARALELIEEPMKPMGTWSPGASLTPGRSTVTSMPPLGSPPVFKSPPPGSPAMLPPAQEPLPPKSPAAASPAAGSPPAASPEPASPPAFKRPPPAAPAAATPPAASPPAAPQRKGPPPPPRRPSLRPEPILLQSIRPDSEPPPRSILPDTESLRKIAIVAAGAPSDPPGVLSIDGDDILIADLELVPASLRPQDKALGVLAGATLFSDLEMDQRRRLVQSVGVVTLTPGEVLFEQGAPADAMYVVVEGEVIARVKTAGAKTALDLAVLTGGDFFGEIGLLGDQPRQASIVAKTEVTLLSFGREEMTRLVDSDERFRFAMLRFLRERLVDTLMLTSPLFQPFGPDDRAALKRLFRFVEVTEGTTMLAEGKKADGMYVLVAGEASVRHSGYGEDILLGMLAPGDVFGEMSLLHNKPAMASIVARTRCYALRLPDRYFMEVLMLHPLLLEHVGNLGAERAEQNAALLGAPAGAPAAEGPTGGARGGGPVAGPPSSVEDAHVTLF